MAPKKTKAKPMDWKSELMAGGDVVRELSREGCWKVLETLKRRHAASLQIR
jgi:hypothetical protein